jgi:hypothetical protein
LRRRSKQKERHVVITTRIGLAFGIRTVALIAVAILANGCATIISGPSQKLTITSEPSPASVIVNDVAKGETPLTVKVRRRDIQTVNVQREGYEPYELVTDQVLNPWFLGNAIFPIGVFVDFGTSAAAKVVPSEIHAVLGKKVTVPRTPELPPFLSVLPRDNAVVCFYRKKKFEGSMVPCTISEGDNRVGTLTNGSHAHCTATPGRHVYKTTFGSYHSQKEVVVEPGGVYYIRTELGGVLTLMPGRQALQELGGLIGR